MLKLLYITFIDFGKATSGSSVRPQKMYEAFTAMGLEIKLLQCQQNRFRQRRKNVLEIIRWLDNNRPDICYIEPPSGPFFNLIDLRLLKKLKKMGIPMGLFYRDMYWKFGLHNQEKGIIASLKALLIRFMHLRDWHVFMNTLSMLYFPTVDMANILKSACPVKALPPGCFRAPVDINEQPADKDVLTGLYIGGLMDIYGPLKLIRAAELINSEKVKFRLKIICREREWKSFLSDHQLTLNYDWLEVLHISGDDQLKIQYASADFTLCPQQVNEYNNITISVKLLEYLSYLKPVVATSCKAMKAYVEEFGIGIVTEDTVQDYSQGILRMIEDNSLREQLRLNCVEARERNLWIRRAQTVVEDLVALKGLE